EDRRSAVADASKPAGERKRLDDERAMLEFAAHEHGDPAPAMPDPGPQAVDFGAAQWGGQASPVDQRWVVSTDPVFLRAMVEREIDAVRARVAKAQLDLFGAKSPDIFSPGHTRHPEQVEPLTMLLAELDRKSAIAEQAHLAAAQKREQTFPILSSYRKASDHR